MTATIQQPIPCERPDEDVLRDFREELRLATVPHLQDVDGVCWCDVAAISIVKTMDDAILTSAEWRGEYERGGNWFRASVEWWLQSVGYCIIDGRNSWRCVYRVDVE